MSQTRKQSLLEATTSVFIGYLVSLLAQMLILPLYGVYVSFTDNLFIGLWFTVISVIRSYAVRRWFNARGSKC